MVTHGVKYNTSFYNKETPQGSGVSLDFFLERLHVRDINMNTLLVTGKNSTVRDTEFFVLVEDPGHFSPYCLLADVQPQYASEQEKLINTAVLHDSYWEIM